MSDDHQPDSGGEWRWPHQMVMSPSSLKAYSQCAYRNKLRYLQNIDPPDQFVPAFAVGNATHSALGTIAQQLKLDVPTIGEHEIRMLCNFHMPEREYPSPEAREAEIRHVLMWVERGKQYLQSLQVQEWLLIERGERREVPLLPTGAPYKLMAKPDLIVRRLDDDGAPLIHVIDWKTGKMREEPDVPVIMRYVIRHRLQEWTGDASAASVRFTWNWLDEQFRKDVDLSVEYCNEMWQGILEQMEAMATETEWKATPGWYCRYCPYYQNHCTEEIPRDLE